MKKAELLLAKGSSPAFTTLVVTASEQAGVRFLEFFGSAVRNPQDAPRVSARPVSWCAAGVWSITAVQPLHVAT